MALKVLAAFTTDEMRNYMLFAGAGSWRAGLIYRKVVNRVRYQRRYARIGRCRS